MEQSPDIDGIAEQKYLSTAQVARALGVSVTTVKRWVDERVLPAHRTPGGHRKLLMTDVLRLVRDGNLPQADLSQLVPSSGLVATEPDEVGRQFLNALVRDDIELVRPILIGAYQSGMSVETIADRVISPAMVYVGSEWHAGRWSVSREHRTSQAVIAAMYELRSHLRSHADPNRPVAVGGAPEHDHAALPSLLAKLTLLDAGWNAINLGPHTPTFAFRSAINDLQPALVWVSVTHVPDTERFIAEFNELSDFAERKQVAIAVGGRGLIQPIRERLRYTTYGDGFTQLHAFAKTMYRRRSQPRRGRPPLNATD